MRRENVTRLYLALWVVGGIFVAIAASDLILRGDVNLTFLNLGITAIAIGGLVRAGRQFFGP